MLYVGWSVPTQTAEITRNAFDYFSENCSDFLELSQWGILGSQINCDSATDLFNPLKVRQ